MRVLNVVDDVTRECLAAAVDTSISGRRAVRELGDLIARRGTPRIIVSDNGTELTSNAVLAWSGDTGVEWHYIAPGKALLSEVEGPTQNGFVESFCAHARQHRSASGCRWMKGGGHVSAHAVVLMDQAGWHMTDKLDVSGNISIIALPAKCPELNPVQNVWQFMRDNWLSNRAFTSHDNIIDHCCEAWNKLIDQPRRIMTIGRCQWAHGS